jgi:hypothetical protein
MSSASLRISWVRPRQCSGSFTDEDGISLGSKVGVAALYLAVRIVLTCFRSRLISPSRQTLSAGPTAALHGACAHPRSRIDPVRGPAVVWRTWVCLPIGRRSRSARVVLKRLLARELSWHLPPIAPHHVTVSMNGNTSSRGYGDTLGKYSLPTRSELNGYFKTSSLMSRIRCISAAGTALDENVAPRTVALTEGVQQKAYDVRTWRNREPATLSCRIG